MAAREAIAEARVENGLGKTFFPLSSPAMVDDILAACCGANDEAAACAEQAAWERGLVQGKSASEEGGQLQDVAKQFR